MTRATVFRQAMTRGALIVFEGLDRSGKTTQTQKLKDYLIAQGQDAVLQRFPDRSEPLMGPTIDNYLRTAKSVDEDKEAIHLMFAANRHLLRKRIEDHLSAGTHVIVDRYSFSGITYSLAKSLPLDFVTSSEIGLTHPDAVFYFSIDPDVTKQRGGFGDEVMEKNDFQKVVRGHMEKFLDESYWRIVDANQSIDDVHESVKALAAKVISDAADKPLSHFQATDFDVLHAKTL